MPRIDPPVMLLAAALHAAELHGFGDTFAFSGTNAHVPPQQAKPLDHVPDQAEGHVPDVLPREGLLSEALTHMTSTAVAHIPDGLLFATAPLVTTFENAAELSNQLFEHFINHSLEEIAMSTPADTQALMVALMGSLGEQSSQGVGNFFLPSSVDNTDSGSKTDLARLEMTELGVKEEFGISEETSVRVQAETPIGSHAYLSLDIKQFVGKAIEALHEQGPEDIKEFVAGWIETVRDHVPEDIRGFLAELIERIDHDTHETATWDGALDHRRAIDPIDVKQFVAEAIETLREQAFDGTKEFIEQIVEKLREHVPNDIKVGDFREHTGSLLTEFTPDLDSNSADIAEDLGFLVSADGLLGDSDVAGVPDNVTNDADDFWL